MVTSRDEAGLRALHLAAEIIHETENRAHAKFFVGDRQLWREQITRLCAEHFAEADRTIEQLVRNAAEMAKAKTRSGIVTLPEPYLGNVIGPAGVPGERG